MTDLKQVFSDLVGLEIELWDAMERRLRDELDLPMGNFEVMRVIARTGNCRVHDIARELSITVGGTSKAVDRIEATGHCVRRANPGDRRSSIIELSPAGVAVLTEATKVFEAELEIRLGAVLTPRALQQLASSLAKLRAAGTELTEGTTTP
jgi:MarR family transcriptional regulator, organic hydroperoxide resistance regulator